MWRFSINRKRVLPCSCHNFQLAHCSTRSSVALGGETQKIRLNLSDSYQSLLDRIKASTPSTTSTASRRTTTSREEDSSCSSSSSSAAACAWFTRVDETAPTPVENWPKSIRESVDFKLRHVFVQRFQQPSLDNVTSAPQFSETNRPLALTENLWREVTNTRRLMAEFDHVCDHKQRLKNLSVAFQFLLENNVLFHGLYHHNVGELRVHNEQLLKTNAGRPGYEGSAGFIGSKNQHIATTMEFLKMAQLGEGIIHSEVLQRIHSVVPEIETDALVQLRDAISCAGNMERLFLDLGVERKMDPGALKPFIEEAKRTSVANAGRAAEVNSSGIPPGLPRDCRALSMFALIGELHWFVAKTRANDRTQNNALFPPSDVLILHVLGAHCQEAIYGHLVYERLAAAMESVKPGWLNYTSSLPQQFYRWKPTQTRLALDDDPCSEQEMVGFVQKRDAPAEKYSMLERRRKGPPSPAGSVLPDPTPMPVLGSFNTKCTPVVHWARFKSDQSKLRGVKIIPPPSLSLSKEPIRKQ